MGTEELDTQNPEMTSESIDLEIIDLTPDMSQVWGNILGKLRTLDNVLYVVCSEQATTDFTKEEIHLYTSNDSVFSILERGQKHFDNIAGPDVIKTFLNKKKALKNTKTDKLRELFKESLTIKP